jgi:hypothetical protein
MANPKVPASNEYQVGGEHYRVSPIQHWDWAWAEQLDFFQYVITKYVSRWKRKNGFEDLEKAHHYLQKYMEVVKDMPTGAEKQAPDPRKIIGQKRRYQRRSI